MAGIAGWVDFHRDLEPLSGVVRAMAATMAHRGPDAEGVWASPHALLGHRRLHVVAAADGAQPMAARSGGSVQAVVVYNGELYNAAGLRAELAARGHRFRTGSDTEVVLRAYLEWREDCPSHLDGMFAFAVWDHERDEAVLVRDRMGLKPLYYQQVGDGLVFGSEPKAILAHPLVDPVVDDDGLREALGFAGTPGITAYRGMGRLLPGELVRFSRRGLSRHRYWTLSAEPHEEDLASTTATVRELLEDAVERRLTSDVPMGVLLSGGVDSSAVAAMAARHLRARGDRLSTFTVGFTVDAAGGVDPQRGTVDEPYAREVAERLGTDHHHFLLSTSDLSDPLVRRGMVAAQHDLPYPVAEALTTMYLTCRAVRDRAPVALTGEWADDAFGSYLGVDVPAVVDGATLPWVGFAQRVTHASGLGTGFFDGDLLKRLDLPGYCADRYRDSVAAAPELPGESAADRRMRRYVHVNLSAWFELGTAMNDGVSMAAGMEWRSPYCDHRLMQYLVNVPWAMKTAGGQRKSLLRSAVADLLPDSVLARGPSPFPVTHDPRYADYLRAELAALLDDSGAPVLPLLDVAAVRAAADDLRSLASGWRARTDVEMVLQTNSWLLRHRIQLV
jgi:asparagine synthase (glutamine-hydrolysing)